VEAYRATACTIAPRIDGVDSPGEWAGATRAEFDLAMGTAKGETRPPRRAELRFMNSSVNLYIAFRVPDAARDLQMTPLVADLVMLAFCRGAELAEGDDRRVLLPGLYADKHVVSPGKDADDAQRDGTGAMRWQAGAGGGEYFVEWQIPLASGDKNISARSRVDDCASTWSTLTVSARPWPRPSSAAALAPTPTTLRPGAR
jgi:hypothetical protein